jgi:hypothetical protein
MERHIINPWTWQDEFGFAQAVEAVGARRVLYCTGQTATDPTELLPILGTWPRRWTWRWVTCSPRLQGGGFSVRPRRHPRESPKGLPGPLNVLRRICTDRLFATRCGQRLPSGNTPLQSWLV